MECAGLTAEEVVEEPVQEPKAVTTKSTNKKKDKGLSVAEQMFGKKLKDLTPEEKSAYNREMVRRHYYRHKATA
jgi:hypothetical protein